MKHLFNLEPITSIREPLRRGRGMRAGRGRSVRKRHRRRLGAVVSRNYRRSGAVNEESQ